MEIKNSLKNVGKAQSKVKKQKAKRNKQPIQQVTISINMSALFVFSLTRRELECCRLLIFGHSASYIAKDLDISVRTVEHYINNLKLKLHCCNKSNLCERLRKLLKISLRPYNA